jgi:hypothetical protein
MMTQRKAELPQGRTSTLTSKTLLSFLVSGMDSGLEAFSHNPTDGSFSALVSQLLASQLTEKPKYLNQLFLSY